MAELNAPQQTPADRRPAPIPPDDHTVWVLAGPTASGKTALSLRLAEAAGCEIVCMDSMQIYRRMDIGTAKPTPAERARAPHHMLDLVDPKDGYTVAQYVEAAEQVIRSIQARGQRALLVGGTGLYLRALRHPMAMGEAAGDAALRDRLQTEADAPGGYQALHDRLAAIDPVTADRLHVNDVRRVIRALEVYSLTGIPFSRQPQKEEQPPFPYRVAALTMDRALLYSRIERRVDLMLSDGLLEEVRSLYKSGLDETCQAMKGLGYKELLPHLRGECSLEEAVYQLKLGTRHYAKRQLTWMRREEDVFWQDALAPDAFQQLLRYYQNGDNEPHDDQ